MENNNEPVDFPYERRQSLNQNGLERHAQTILGAIALALILWVGYTLNENSKTLATVSERMNGLDRQLQEIKGNVKASAEDRYTSRDASMDRGQIMYMIEQLQGRVVRLEEKHEDGK